MSRQPFTREPELTGPVDECLPDGTLNPAAKGWSVHPLHRCNLPNRWGRRKRWDYWAVTSTECALSLTYADLDYLGFVAIALIDFRTRKAYEHATLVPFAAGFRQPETVGGSDIRFRMPGLRLSFVERPGGIRLHGGFLRPGLPELEADVFVRRPPGHETLNVLIPWSTREFQFTSKQNTLPATGRVRLGRRTYDFGPGNQSFGCLDYGRGIWPSRTVWNWGSASGVQNGRTVGLQLGGKWTDGTGMTENGVMVDGKLTKIGEDLVLDYDRKDFQKPWRIRAPETGAMDLTFSPFLERKLKVPLGVAGVGLHLCFGNYSGRVRTAAGETLEIENLTGWAEEMRARW